MENLAVNHEAPSTVNSSVRTREYLTETEIERLMAATRSGGAGLSQLKDSQKRRRSLTD